MFLPAPQVCSPCTRTMCTRNYDEIHPLDTPSSQCGMLVNLSVTGSGMHYKSILQKWEWARRLPTCLTISHCKLSIFPLIPYNVKKLAWIFDPMPVSREIARSPGWDNRVSSRLLALGNYLISILSGCCFETAVTERSQVLLKIAHQFRTKLIM